jgi:hypothetical protein
MPLGFDDRFRVLWEYYLTYCEAGFLSGNIDVRQVEFAKSRSLAPHESEAKRFHFCLVRSRVAQISQKAGKRFSRHEHQQRRR